MTHELIVKARAFAKVRHEGQIRDDGQDYFKAHLERVASAVTALRPDDNELIAAAYLHDTLEDTPTTLEELEREFGARVARIVHELTKDADDTFPRLQSADAVTVKLIDRAQNISDMEAWSEERTKHYVKSSMFWRSNNE
jgi:GTP pyrophosphokinase